MHQIHLMALHMIRCWGGTQPSLCRAVSSQWEQLLSQWCFWMLSKQIYLSTDTYTHSQAHTHIHKCTHTTYCHTLLLLGTGNYHKWQCIIGYLGACYWGLECNCSWTNGELRGQTGRGVAPMHLKALPGVLSALSGICSLFCSVELPNAVVRRLNGR